LRGGGEEKRGPLSLKRRGEGGKKRRGVWKRIRESSVRGKPPSHEKGEKENTTSFFKITKEGGGGGGKKRVMRCRRNALYSRCKPFLTRSSEREKRKGKSFTSLAEHGERKRIFRQMTRHKRLIRRGKKRGIVSKKQKPAKKSFRSGFPLQWERGGGGSAPDSHSEGRGKGRGKTLGRCRSNDPATAAEARLLTSL